MKSKDIFLLIVIGIFSAVISIIVSNLFINTDTNRSQNVEVVSPISADLERPPKEYYNGDSINPTQTIQIGDDSSTQPFGRQ